MGTRSLLAASLLTLGLWSAGAGGVARAAMPLPGELHGSTITEHLGAAVDPNLVFTDYQGNQVRLGSFFGDGKPVILTLNYYGCKMLCTIQLNGLVEGLKELDWTPGDQFRIVTVSINPDDTVQLAHDKRQSYLDAYGRGDVDWTFLVAQEDQVRKLAEQVGFGYRYDAEQDQYAHTAVITLLTPEATVARYIYGIQYSGRDLKFGLIDAAQGRVGSTVDRVILSCFHYDETIGRYSPFAFGIMRLGGALSVLALGGLGVVLWRREFAHRNDVENTESPS